MTTLRFKSKDLAHDCRPFNTMRRDAMAVQTIGEEMADLVRNGVDQEIFGILFEQYTVEANGVLHDMRRGGRHAAKFKVESGAVKAAPIIIFRMAITIFNGRIQTLFYRPCRLCLRFTGNRFQGRAKLCVIHKNRFLKFSYYEHLF